MASQGSTLGEVTGQEKRLVQTLREAKLSVAELQILVENPDVLISIARGRIDRNILQEAVLAATNNPYHPSGWVKSSYHLPDVYSLRVDVETDLKKVRGDYPNFDASHVLAGAALLEERRTPICEGVFVLPKLGEVMSQILGIPKKDHRAEYGRQLCEAHLFPALSKSRADGFTNFRDGEMGPDRLIINDRDWDMLQELEDNTPGDFLTIFVQTGMLHRGESVEYSGWDIEHAEAPAQMGMFTWIVGNILRYHPERFTCWEDLGVDMTAERYRFENEFGLQFAPYFKHDGSRLNFRTKHVTYPLALFGGGSVFVW